MQEWFALECYNAKIQTDKSFAI